MTDDQRLAIVVEKPRAEAVAEQCRDAGVYDGDRSIREWAEDGETGVGTVAVPVTEPPSDVRYREVVRQVGEPRLRTLEDHLRDRGWTDEEIDRAPGSWAVVGSVILVDVGDAPRPGEVGEALLALHGEADTVLSRDGISGEHREPEVSVLAGSGDTETIHREHGTAYALDLAEVMFSPGNEAERVRMGEVVREGRGTRTSERASGDDGPASREAEERVLDMFAGIGYFALPMARAGADVTAVERNPAAFRYLIENAQLNDVGDRLSPYRGDCRDVVPDVTAADPVDRVVMGYFEAHEYLAPAVDALAPGGVLHLHEATPAALAPDRPIERLEAAAAERDRAVEVLETRRVKGYSEGVDHVVVDARVD